MSEWIAIGRDAGAVVAYIMSDLTLQRTLHGTDESTVLGQIDTNPDTIIRIGDGPPAHLPAPLLPSHGDSLSGFSQDRPRDVIGAWVRLWVAGFLNHNNDWDGVICALEGDISHWIHISANEVVSCQSFMTPRLITALGGTTPLDTQAVDDSLSRPERLAAQLRAAEIVNKPAAITGHLIGVELAAARPYWLGQQLALFASGNFMSAYVKALTAQGLTVPTYDPPTLVASGLSALGHALGLSD